MKRQLLIVPDERLRQQAKPIERIDESVRSLATFLLSQVEPTESIGLAATQYGEMVRLIVIRLQGIERVIINPEIVKRQGEHSVEESCRSIPKLHFELQRPRVVKVRGLDPDGNPVSLKGHDTLAQCICHEVDHLDGILLDTIGKVIETEVNS